MPALKKVAESARVIWLGYVPDRVASLEAVALSSVQLSFAGMEGDSHSGATRPACSRVAALHDKGTPIRNTRQLSILSQEELAVTAREMGLAELDPALVGASLVVAGIPDFTHVPPGSRLQAPSAATLAVDMENRPCHLPAPVIDERHPGFGAAFRAASRHRRGVTAWVEREGTLAVGDTLRLFVPDQREWRPETTAPPSDALA